MSAIQPVVPTNEFRSDIEGLRAVAIILVLLYHGGVTWFGGGFMGVDIFFVLSGFLITRSLLGESESTGTVNLKQFYARRVRRLLPASVLVLILTALTVRMVLPATTWTDFGGDIAAASIYIVNWRLADRSVNYLAEGLATSPVQHYWSLSVEEQFYFIWPLLILAGIWMQRRVHWGVRRTIAAILLVVVFLPSLLWSIYHTAVAAPNAFFVTTTRLWELSIGAFVAILGTRISVGRPVIAFFMRMIALAAMIGASVIVDESAPWPGLLALIPTVATAALILAGSNSSKADPIDRFLRLPAMQRIGAWSYSIYLWHWPPLAILAAKGFELHTVETLTVVLASLIPAVMSYRFVENPIRYAPSLKRAPALSLSVGANLTLLGAAVGLFVVLTVPGSETATPAGQDEGSVLGAQALADLHSDAEMLEHLLATSSFMPSPTRATQDLPRIYLDECQVPFETSEPKYCEYGNSEGPVTLALVGDSKIAQYASALIPLAQERNWRLLNITKSGCELSLSMADRSDGPYPECLEWTEHVLDHLASSPPDLVLVSQGSNTAWTTGAGDRQESLIQGMHEAYELLEDAGTHVVIMVDNPHPGMEVYECVSENSDDLSQCTFRIDERIQTGGRVVQLEVAKRYNYPAIDMLDMICPTSTCLPIIGGVLVYRQGSHLTATYVNSMSNSLEARISPYLAADATKSEDPNA